VRCTALNRLQCPVSDKWCLCSNSLGRDIVYRLKFCFITILLCCFVGLVLVLFPSIFVWKELPTFSNVTALWINWDLKKWRWGRRTLIYRPSINNLSNQSVKCYSSIRWQEVRPAACVSLFFILFHISSWVSTIMKLENKAWLFCLLTEHFAK
jgi:hypothetical protein